MARRLRTDLPPTNLHFSADGSINLTKLGGLQRSAALRDQPDANDQASDAGPEPLFTSRL